MLHVEAARPAAAALRPAARRQAGCLEAATRTADSMVWEGGRGKKGGASEANWQPVDGVGSRDEAIWEVEVEGRSRLLFGRRPLDAAFEAPKSAKGKGKGRGGRAERAAPGVGPVGPRDPAAYRDPCTCLYRSYRLATWATLPM